MQRVAASPYSYIRIFFFFQAEDGIRDYKVTGVQTCALPISSLNLASNDNKIYRKKKMEYIGMPFYSASVGGGLTEGAALDSGLRDLGIGRTRSEERGVGKECRSRWSPYH